MKRTILIIIGLLMVGFSVVAQNTVKGTVTDKSGQPIPGVNILEKNTSHSSITDFDGKYIIKVGSKATLVFTYLGFKTQEIVVNGRETIAVNLLEDSAQLDEVVVIGYGTSKRSNITTAISKVDPKDIPKSANQSVSELLFGKAAGVNVNQQSSQPGGNIGISIRGKGNPLYVVDGVVYPGSGLEPDNGNVELQGVDRGPLANLNPNDIESIEFLKDASAAIYGVAAANGVVLITTKKGVKGKVNVTYSANTSVVSNLTYLDPLNAQDYMTYYNQLDNDKYLIDKKMQPFGTIPSSGYVPKFSNQEISNAGQGTDWLGQVLKNGQIENHNLSVSGGTETVRYYFSGNYFNQQGTVKGSNLKKFTGRLNFSVDLSKIFTFNTSVNINRNNYSNPQAGWQAGGSGAQGFNALQAALAYPSNVPVYNIDDEYSLFGLTGNPVSLLNIKDKTETNGTLSNLSLDVNIIPGVLSGKVSYGNNKEFSVRDFYIPKDVFWFQLYRARASLSEARRENQTLEANISFKKKIGDILNIDAVTGVGQYIDKDNGFGIEASDIEDAINTDALQNATGPKSVFSYRNVREYRSFFVRSSFDFYNKYLITLTLRRDGADRFFPDNKYQNFPSASLGWKLSNESFMKNAEFIDLLKLRGSYGLTGERPGDLAYGLFKGDNTAITFNNGSVLYIPYGLSSLDDPNLKWPLTETIDLGIDFSFFRNRISGSLDWFKESRDRLLVNTTTAQLSFISSKPINAGKQERKGYEFSLSTKNIQSDNFSWNSTFNFTNFENRWVERFPNDVVPQYANINDPLGIIYVYKTKGILQIGEQVPLTQPNGAKLPGSPIFVDQNQDGKLDFNDVVSYSSVPKAIIGFGNNFKYKKVDLGIFFYGQFGAYGFDNTLTWASPLGLLANTQGGTERLKEVWSTNNVDGTLPGVAYNEANVALDASVDTNLANKDFLRCRNVTLGYTLDNHVFKKYFNNIRFYVDLQNAFIITKFKGVDPETQAASVKGGPAPYPSTRTFSLGLTANF